MTSDWIIEADVLVHIDRNSIILGESPRRELASIARSGFPVFGRRSPADELELIPQDDWQYCHVDPRLRPGIHFDPQATAPWCDLAIRRSDLEARWPRKPTFVELLRDELAALTETKPPQRRPRGKHPIFEMMRSMAYAWLKEYGDPTSHPVIDSGELAQFKNHLKRFCERHDHYPVESTIRRYAKDYIAEFSSAKRARL